MNTNNKLNKANSYRVSQELLRNKALKNGVNLISPETVFLSKDTSFGKNVTIEPYVVIGSKVKIGDNSYIKSFSHLEGTIIKKNALVGPYARLRPGTIIKDNVKIGNFVESKNSTVDNFSKVKFKARGNNEKYFIHIKTKGSFFPWVRYLAEFEVTEEWKDFEIEFSKFVRYSNKTPKKRKLNPSKIRLIGVEASGRDFDMNIDIALMSFSK